MADYSIKVNLVRHYLSAPTNQILTPKELNEWCALHKLDFAHVKTLNADLVACGILRERKKPQVFFQIYDDGCDGGLSVKLEKLV